MTPAAAPPRAGRVRVKAASWQPANPMLRGVRLGTAVRVWLPGRCNRGTVMEGVVVAVVPPGTPVPVPAANHRPLIGWRNMVPHYVVQCSNVRVLRRASEMDVVSL